MDVQVSRLFERIGLSHPGHRFADVGQILVVDDVCVQVTEVRREDTRIRRSKDYDRMYAFIQERFSQLDSVAKISQWHLENQEAGTDSKQVLSKPRCMSPLVQLVADSEGSITVIPFDVADEVDDVVGCWGLFGTLGRRRRSGKGSKAQGTEWHTFEQFGVTRKRRSGKPHYIVVCPAWRPDTRLNNLRCPFPPKPPQEVGYCSGEIEDRRRGIPSDVIWQCEEHMERHCDGNERGL